MRGPGCFDMKAGLAMAFHALAGLDDRDGVTLLVTGDEEIGSPTLAGADRGGGPAGVGRAGARGLGRRRRPQDRAQGRLAVRRARARPGRARRARARAGRQRHPRAGAPGAGRRRRSPTPARGTTVTPTVMRAGTTTNTVPAEGSFAVDVRVRTLAEQARVDAALRSLRTVRPGGRRWRSPAAPTGRRSRPRRRPRCSRGPACSPQRLGLPEPMAAAVGGGSDGNFTAGVGTPTLDGLGAVGGGAHADDEHVLVDALPGRTALLAALVADLLADRDPTTTSRRRVPPDHDEPGEHRHGPRDAADPRRHRSGPGGAGGGRRRARRRRHGARGRPTSPSSRTWCGCSPRSGAATPTRR